MTDDLPPHDEHFLTEAHRYTADQMREYGRACAKAAYERAAKTLEAHPSYDFCRCQSECAAEIRALG